MADSEHTELKAGHAPAMKVGGKRVALPKHVHEEKPEATTEAEFVDQDKGSPSKTVVVSGAQVKEKDAFSTEAVKNMHEKPMPTVGHSNIHAHNANHIQQPRKN